MNVIDAIRHHARMRPYDMAVIHPGGAVNYLQLAGALANLSLKLRSHGVEPGMTVAVYVSDPLLHLALVLAGMVNGTASISAHPNYDPVPAAAKADAYLVDRNLPFTPPAPVIPVGNNWIGEVPLDAQPVLNGPGFPGPDAICRLYTSSGTTGVPKVIARTVAATQSSSLRSIAIEPLASGPNLCMMWLSTIGGFGTASASLWQGCTVVLAVAPLAVLRSINLYRVKSLRASPQQLQGLVDIVRGRSVRFPSLERVEVGGSSTPQSLVLAARATLCTNVVGVYGSTEAGLVAQTPTSMLSLQSEAAGYVVPGVSVRIVDDAGQPVPAGSEGHVQIRTPDMCNGYVGDPEGSAASFRDGWFLPGDMGSLGTDGLLRITGRADEMINAGGVKLSPVLVDDFLLTQPGVREAAAFAYRQPGRSDQVWAAVVCADGFNEQAVLNAARTRLNSRAPVRLLRMTEIPRNAMGKPLRQKLSQDAQQQP